MPVAGSRVARRWRSSARVLAELVRSGAGASSCRPSERSLLSAQALDARTVEARFVDRRRLLPLPRQARVRGRRPRASRRSGALPPGKVKDDQFFGKVETYRGRVVVRLPLDKHRRRRDAHGARRVAGLRRRRASATRRNAQAVTRRRCRSRVRRPGPAGRCHARQEVAGSTDPVAASA